MSDLYFCNKCQTFKSTNDFYWFKDKIKTPCKECKLKYQKNYYEENVEEIEEYRQEYYSNNRDKIIENQLARDMLRQDEIKIYQKQYRQDNKEELRSQSREYKKNRRQTDVAFRLRGIVSNAVYQALKFNNATKNGNSIIDNLNYTMDDLKKHLEVQFEPWMNWKNWGIYNSDTWNDNDPTTWTWQIDHIIPQINLPYTSMEDENFKKCWSLENLRPYSAKLNALDGAFKNRNRL
jgi:hypothetical protein